MVLYGQVVVGPPGSGKTTYCNGMQQYLRLIGRETLVVNLDPANEYQPSNDDDESNDREDSKDECNDKQRGPQQSHLPYDTILDSSEDVINLSSAMTELDLGPNGGLVYCMEYMEHHLDELLQLLRSRLEEHAHPPYLLFDFPGQVELYTHCTCVQTILARLVRELDLRLCAVHLVDAHSCTDATKFIATALLSTTTMLRLELPAVNVLSKIDLIGQYGPDAMPFNLDYFMECHELERLLPFMDGEEGAGGRSDKENELQWRIEEDDEYRRAREKTRSTGFHRRHQKLHKQLCEVIDDFSLLCYIPLNINDAESVGRVVAKIDKCNGYVFLSSALDGHNNDAQKQKADVHDMFQCAMQADSQGKFEQVADVQEKYIYRETIPELHGDEVEDCTK